MNVANHTERHSTLRIPKVPGHPIWKNANDLFNRPLQFFRDSYLSYGPVFRVSGPGRSYIIIAGPEANKKLLTRSKDHLFDHKPIYAHIARELKSEHYVISTEGERHSRLRQQVAKQLSARAVAPRLPGMLATASSVCRRWRKGQTYQVLHEMHQLVGDQVGIALANEPLDTHLNAAITFARYSVGPGLGSYPKFLRFHPKYLASSKRMVRFMNRVIDDHRKRTKVEGDPTDFIDGLLSCVDENGQSLPDAAIFANAQMVYSNSILYGGPSVAFLLYMILKDQELLNTLTNEIDEAIHHPITPMFLCQLPTVMKVVKESMRIHPVALATPRVVKESFEFEGYQIPKGEKVLVVGSVCHHLDNFYPNAEQINPDRKQPAGKHNAYVPFGSGSHSCPAGGFMEVVFAVSIVAILSTVKLKLTPHDYTLRKVVNPFPEPANDFRFEVVEIRTK